MKRLQGAYATRFRVLHPLEFKQQVFEGRFKSKLITDKEYLNKCLVYVSFNPLKHELVKDIRDYPYTSYHQLKNKNQKIEYQDYILDELEL